MYLLHLQYYMQDKNLITGLLYVHCLNKFLPPYDTSIALKVLPDNFTSTLSHFIGIISFMFISFSLDIADMVLSTKKYTK